MEVAYEYVRHFSCPAEWRAERGFLQWASGLGPTAVALRTGPGHCFSGTVPVTTHITLDYR